MSDPAPDLPVAVVRPERRTSAAWIVPLLALLVAAWLGVQALRQRGTVVVVRFADARGLEVGAPVRYLGTVVGEVRDIELEPELDRVRVVAGLRDQGRRLARAGTRFWVVRPRLDLAGASGLETIVGPRYLALLPGPAEGEATRFFEGVEEAPVVALTDPEDLEIVIEAPTRGGLAPGAALAYRRVRIGTVRSVGLASDAGSVEVRVHVPKAYRGLIRERSRFWTTSGLSAEIGLRGVTLEAASLAELLLGGLAVATPPADEAGAEVVTGHRFALEAEADDDWLGWTPAVAVGNELLPRGATLPRAARATLAWKGGLLLKRGRTRSGWVLATEAGLLGPADLFTAAPEDRVVEGSVALEVAGRAVPLDAAAIRARAGLAWLDAPLDGPVWPRGLLRAATEPEDVLVVGDPAAAALPIAAARLRVEEGAWRIDGAVGVEPELHGAPVVARSDGRLLGIVIVEEKMPARIELVEPSDLE